MRTTIIAAVFIFGCVNAAGAVEVRGSGSGPGFGVTIETPRAAPGPDYEYAPGCQAGQCRHKKVIERRKHGHDDLEFKDRDHH